MADGGAGGVEQRAAHKRSSVAGFGLSALFTAFVSLGGESDKGCDLLSGQTAEAPPTRSGAPIRPRHFAPTNA
jgi:hypothetical protein